MTDFEEVTVPRKDAPDVVFEGKLIAEVDNRAEMSADPRKSKDRWTELAVYELRSGDWVAVSIGCSDKERESDFGEVQIIASKVPDSMGALVSGNKPGAPTPIAGRRSQAMEFWGWTWLAKKLADKAGWDVRERIE